MGRLGVRPDQAMGFMRNILANPHLLLEGVMAHLPFADSIEGEDPDAGIEAGQFRETNLQIEAFAALRREAEAAGIRLRYWHTQNTAGILQHPSSAFNAARTGIAIYGQYPSFEMPRTLALQPAMTLKSTISFVKDVPSGIGLSYGHVYRTARPSRIATVALGYADGYPRHATNLTEMLVRSKRAPVVGRVCMDHTLLDITDIPDAEEGDTVVVFGTSGDSTMSAEETASRFGSLGYELTTRIGKRVRKIFL
jgi:alanine racemase